MIAKSQQRVGGVRQNVHPLQPRRPQNDILSTHAWDLVEPSQSLDTPTSNKVLTIVVILSAGLPSNVLISRDLIRIRSSRCLREKEDPTKPMTLQLVSGSVYALCVPLTVLRNKNSGSINLSLRMAAVATTGLACLRGQFFTEATSLPTDCCPTGLGPKALGARHLANWQR